MHNFPVATTTTHGEELNNLPIVKFSTPRQPYASSIFVYCFFTVSVSIWAIADRKKSNFLLQNMIYYFTTHISERAYFAPFPI